MTSTSRRCPKCQAPVRVERSKVRLTLRCTVCSYKAVKNIIKKGFG